MRITSARARALIFLISPSGVWAQPSPVNNLAAFDDAQMRLQWTVPALQPNLYDIRWSTTGPVTTEADFSTATVLGAPAAGFVLNPTAIPAPAAASTTQSFVVTGLKPRQRFYWAIKSSSDGGGTWSGIDTTAVRPSTVAGSFMLAYSNGSPQSVSRLRTGDFDRDGDPDVLLDGGPVGGRYLYRNNGFLGAGGFSQLITNVAIGGQGLDLADFDGDGFLDQAIGQGGLKIFRGDGTQAGWTQLGGTIATAGGVEGVAAGDCDNDGDPDLAVALNTLGTQKIKIYRNDQGAFSLVWSSTETSNFINNAIAWGDFDSDGDLDLVAPSNYSGVNQPIRVYTNTGQCSLVNTWTSAVGTYGRPVVGDYDYDGDLDFITSHDTARNNNTTFALTQSWAGGTQAESTGAFGDLDFDGDLDIAFMEGGLSNPGFRVFPFQSASFSLNPAQSFQTAATNADMALADFDGDGDLDMVHGSGFDPLEVYKSLEAEFGVSNSTPSPPSGLAGGLVPNGVVELGWSAGSYDGAFSTNSLYFQVAVATCTASPCLVLDATQRLITAPSKFISSPFFGGPMGSHIRPRLAPNQLGLRLRFGGLPENATYYFRVATIDAGLKASTWSAEASIYVSEAPSAVVNLATAAATQGDDQALLQWTAPGDDGTSGSAAGYEIRYSTENITSGNFGQATLWASSRVPAGPGGTAETETITGLAPAATYYFALKARDDAGNATPLSNVVSYLTGQDIPVSVAAFSPPANLFTVPVSTSIVVRFSKAITSTTLSGGFWVRAVRDKDGVAADLPVTGAITYSSTTRMMTFAPAGAFFKNFTYEVVVSTAVRDLFNAPMASSAVWRFATLFDRSVANTVVTEQGLRFSVPANAFASDGQVFAATSAQTAAMAAATQKLLTQDSYRTPIRIYDFVAFDASNAAMQPSQSLSVSVPYSDADGNGLVDGTSPPVRETALALWWFDPATQNWNKIPGASVDASANTLASPVPHFSIFALIGGQNTDLSGAFAYPVPYIPSQQAARKITFKNLSSEAAIRIYTVSGGLVQAISETDGDGVATWDVKNSAGQDVASGVYLYVISNEREEKRGKLVIIR